MAATRWRGTTARWASRTGTAQPTRSSLAATAPARPGRAPPIPASAGTLRRTRAGPTRTASGTGPRRRSPCAAARTCRPRASIADPRLAERAGRQNGGFGVEDFDAPAHAVLGEGTVRNTRVSVADPRLGCEPRSGHYGVIDGAEPSPTIIGHHQHDRAPASVADPRLHHEPRRGTFGVLDQGAPAPTIRARHDARQAPAAVVDDRGWPLPTHELVREGEALVLYGPPIDLKSKRPCLLVIRAPDGTWHRPLTDRELATLQGFPLDAHFEGPSASSRKGAGRREHIGNAIPPPTAEAIAREVAAAIIASRTSGFRLASGDIWVQPEEAARA
nr:DNA cytosine methyltransferase [Nannocystis pusilla]